MSESVIGNDVRRPSSPPTTPCIASEMLVFAIAAPLWGTQLPDAGLGPVGGQSLGSPGSSHVVKRNGAPKVFSVGHDRASASASRTSADVGHTILLDPPRSQALSSRPRPSGIRRSPKTSP